MPRPTSAPTYCMGAETRMIRRSSALSLRGSRTFERSTKNGSANRRMTTTASRLLRRGVLMPSSLYTSHFSEAGQTGSALPDRDLAQQLHVIERLARAQDHRADRI